MHDSFEYCREFFLNPKPNLPKSITSKTEKHSLFILINPSKFNTPEMNRRLTEFEEPE